MKKLFILPLAALLLSSLSACLSNTSIIGDDGDSLTLTGQIANYSRGVQSIIGTNVVAVLGQGSTGIFSGTNYSSAAMPSLAQWFVVTNVRNS